MLKSIFSIAALGALFSGFSLWGEEDLSLSKKLDGLYYYKDGKKGALATLTA